MICKTTTKGHSANAENNFVASGAQLCSLSGRPNGCQCFRTNWRRRQRRAFARDHDVGAAVIDAEAHRLTVARRVLAARAAGDFVGHHRQRLQRAFGAVDVRNVDDEPQTVRRAGGVVRMRQVRQQHIIVVAVVVSH